MAWKSNIEATMERLDRTQQNTMDVLKDMKDLLTKISSGAFGSSPNVAATTSNLPDLSNSPLPPQPRNNTPPQAPTTNAFDNHVVRPEQVCSPLSYVDNSSASAATAGNQQILSRPPVNVPISPDNRKTPSPRHDAEDDMEFGQSTFSDDPDFMTQPPAKATRSQKTVPQKKSIVPKKYLKLKGPLRTVPPVERPSIGRINPRGRTNHPIACNKHCWILHPDVPGLPVAYGRSGISWKSTRKNQLYTPCDLGQQMVQVHHVYDTSMDLMFCELERQPFTRLIEAMVPQGNSTIYVKWAHHLLVRDLGAEDIASLKP